MERVFAWRLEGERLIVRVSSGGCTTGDDFRLKRLPNSISQGPIALALLRNRLDHCKGFFPEGEEITLRLEDWGVGPAEEVYLLNVAK